jgi:hypothetical protein
VDELIDGEFEWKLSWWCGRRRLVCCFCSQKNAGVLRFSEMSAAEKQEGVKN